MSNQVVTIGYLKSFVSGKLSVSTSKPDSYCPTYSELTSGGLVKNYQSASNPKDTMNGIHIPQCSVNTGYASNQLVVRQDLELKYMVLDGIAITAKSTSISECGGSTEICVEGTFHLVTKTENGSTNGVSLVDKTILATWGGDADSVGPSTCTTISFGENMIGGNDAVTENPQTAPSRSESTTATYTYKGNNLESTNDTTKTSNTVTVVQSANVVGSWYYVSSEDYATSLVASCPGVVSEYGGSATVTSTLNYMKCWKADDSCGHIVGKKFTPASKPGPSQTVSFGEQDCDAPSRSQTVTLSESGQSASCTVTQAASTVPCKTCTPSTSVTYTNYSVSYYGGNVGCDAEATPSVTADKSTVTTDEFCVESQPSIEKGVRIYDFSVSYSPSGSNNTGANRQVTGTVSHNQKVVGSFTYTQEKCAEKPQPPMCDCNTVSVSCNPTSIEVGKSTTITVSAGANCSKTWSVYKEGLPLPILMNQSGTNFAPTESGNYTIKSDACSFRTCTLKVTNSGGGGTGKTYTYSITNCSYQQGIGLFNDVPTKGANDGFYFLMYANPNAQSDFTVTSDGIFRINDVITKKPTSVPVGGTVYVCYDDGTTWKTIDSFQVTLSDKILNYGCDGTTCDCSNVKISCNPPKVVIDGTGLDYTVVTVTVGKNCDDFFTIYDRTNAVVNRGKSGDTFHPLKPEKYRIVSDACPSVEYTLDVTAEYRQIKYTFRNCTEFDIGLFNTDKPSHSGSYNMMPGNIGGAESYNIWSTKSGIVVNDGISNTPEGICVAVGKEIYLFAYKYGNYEKIQTITVVAQDTVFEYGCGMVCDKSKVQISCNPDVITEGQETTVTVIADYPCPKTWSVYNEYGTLIASNQSGTKYKPTSSGRFTFNPDADPQKSCTLKVNKIVPTCDCNNLSITCSPQNVNVNESSTITINGGGSACSKTWSVYKGGTLVASNQNGTTYTPKESGVYIIKSDACTGKTCTLTATSESTVYTVTIFNNTDEAMNVDSHVVAPSYSYMYTNENSEYKTLDVYVKKNNYIYGENCVVSFDGTNLTSIIQNNSSVFEYTKTENTSTNQSYKLNVKNNLTSGGTSKITCGKITVNVTFDYIPQCDCQDVSITCSPTRVNEGDKVMVRLNAGANCVKTWSLYSNNNPTIPLLSKQSGTTYVANSFGTYAFKSDACPSKYAGFIVDMKPTNPPQTTYEVTLPYQGNIPDTSTTFMGISCDIFIENNQSIHIEDNKKIIGPSVALVSGEMTGSTTIQNVANMMIDSITPQIGVSQAKDFDITLSLPYGGFVTATPNGVGIGNVIFNLKSQNIKVSDLARCKISFSIVNTDSGGGIGPIIPGM